MLMANSPRTFRLPPSVREGSDAMATTPTIEEHGYQGAQAGRIIVGLIWIAGAVFNILVTTRMERPFDWIADESRLGVMRWFFGEVVSACPVGWTVLLAIAELAIGVLTLMKGQFAKVGLAGGVLFSLFLFGMATPYTVVMGPYALFLFWRTRKEYPETAWSYVRAWLHNRGEGTKPHTA